MHYLAAEKVINLANEVFGFNGWSSSIQNVQIDFVDENPQTQRINLGLSTIVRVTLKDGTFHEDIGYGHCENTKGKAAAFEKAKKEAATDAMKRALRNFGNVLGNCLYDKDYLQRVTKVKVAPSKWDAENLHRHPDFAPIKREPATQNENLTEGRANPPQRNPGVHSARSGGSFGEFNEDDFGGNEFDETDFSHPDEVRVDDSGMSNGHMSPAVDRTAQPRNPLPRTTSMPQMRPPNIQGPPPVQGVPNPPPPQAISRPGLNGNQPANRMLPPQTPGNQQRPPHQHTANALPQSIPDNGKSNVSSGGSADSPSLRPQNGLNDYADDQPAQPPPGAPIGFVSGKAVAAPQAVANAAFNPHAESPSIRRTQGVNPGTSAPIRRTQIAGAQQTSAPTLPPTGAAALQNGAAATTNGFNGASRPTSANYINPQADMSRRIGMPQQGRSGFQHAGGYKPPTAVKRAAMADVTNTHMANGQMDGAGDSKKQKLDSTDEGGGVEKVHISEPTATT